MQWNARGVSLTRSSLPALRTIGVRTTAVPQKVGRFCYSSNIVVHIFSIYVLLHVYTLFTKIQSRIMLFK